MELFSIEILKNYRHFVQIISPFRVAKSPFELSKNKYAKRNEFSMVVHTKRNSKLLLFLLKAS